VGIDESRLQGSVTEVLADEANKKRLALGSSPKASHG
jgi:hypothetical protein